MHAQARRTLALAAVFVGAAPVVAVVPHDTGSWLPLHLFLVGGVVGAIVGATQLLAATWSGAPAPPAALARAQRALLAAGTIAIAVGREADTRAVVAVGGAAVAAALVLLVVALVGIRRGAVNDRYAPAIDAYVAAAVSGLAGTTLGTLLASDAFGGSYVDARDAHVAANLLGLVGLVIAGTLPYFAATQARMKMSPRATPTRIRRTVAWLVAAVAVAVIGAATGNSAVSAAGFAAYAAGIVGVASLLPRIGRKQLDWAGARLVQFGAAIGWWALSTALLGWHEAGGGPDRAEILRALAIGAYAQLVLASLAYFGPVLIGGGHRDLSEGFRVTRSWIGLVAANVAAVAALVGWGGLTAAAIVVWFGDSAVRATRLASLAARRQARPAR